MIRYERKMGRLCWLMDEFSLPVSGFGTVSDDWVSVGENILIVKRGFAWDGPWPLPRLRCAMRASMVHDALYHLLRSGKLSMTLRKPADDLFRRLCIEDGMPPWLAAVCYWAVRLPGGWRSRPSLASI